MDIDALKSFLAFVETGSITRAAKQVNRSQSAISMQMKKLEQDLDKQLFEKQGRNLVLSKSGNHLVPYALKLVKHYDETLNLIKNDDVPVKIKLACPDDYAQSVLPKLVSNLHKLYPNLDLTVKCIPSHEIKVQLDSGDLDLGIVTRSVDSEEGHLIFKDKGVWVCGSNAEIIDQTPLPLVTFLPDCRFHHAAIEGLHKQHIEFKLLAQCGSAAAMTGLIKEGIAIGAMARSSKGTLIELNENILPPLPEISVVLLTTARSRHVFDRHTIEAIINISGF